MKIVALGALMVMLALTPPVQAALELRLTTRLPEQLPYLRPDMRLEVVNRSPDAVRFPKNAFRVGLFLETEAGWRECRPLVASTPRLLSSIDWHEISPGETFPVSIPGSRCSKGEGTWFEWANLPGTHRVKVVLTTYAHEAGMPAGAFDGVLESSVLEFRIKEPVGVDAEAIAWAKGSPMNVGLLGAFPTSEYAAFFVYGKSRHIDEVEPARIRTLIERGQYPGPNSVPGQDGWRSLNSEGYARWQVEWGQRVLREHPNLSFRDEMRVSIALAQMSLGERKEALSTLKELAEKGEAAVAKWSSTFLDAEPKKNDRR